MKKEKATDLETLGGRLKSYEKMFEQEVPSDSHIMVRIDGHHFSKYTKGFEKPYDYILSEAMVRTTIDLVEKFYAYTGYTQSDEITLFIPSLKDISNTEQRVREKYTHPFSGRVQKMASLIAAFTTMSFNKHMIELCTDPKLSAKVGNAYFDARVFGVEDDSEAFNTFMWRVRDAEKNSRSMFAQAYCSHKELQNLTGPEQVAYCKDKTGKDWDVVDDRYKYGTFVKRELFKRFVSENEYVDRSRLCTFSTPLTNYSPEGVSLVVSKYKEEN